jgi:hypothetical protein
LLQSFSVRYDGGKLVDFAKILGNSLDLSAKDEESSASWPCSVAFVALPQMIVTARPVKQSTMVDLSKTGLWCLGYMSSGSVQMLVFIRRTMEMRDASVTRGIWTTH